MRLFRPVGVMELGLIREADFTAFPPRLPHQPIFYPVLDEAYANQIARDWNTRDPASGFGGFVTAFEIGDEVARRYPVQTVGKTSHRELWVPAEELADFNRALTTPIAVLRHFLGARFQGSIDPDTHLPTGPLDPVRPTEGMWRVLRFDDNGNEFEIERGMDLEVALRLVGEYEARGHKQTYWAELGR